MLDAIGVTTPAEFSQLDPAVVVQVIEDWRVDADVGVAGVGALVTRLRRVAAGHRYTPRGVSAREAREARMRAREARIASLSADLASSFPEIGRRRYDPIRDYDWRTDGQVIESHAVDVAPRPLQLAAGG